MRSGTCILALKGNLIGQKLGHIARTITKPGLHPPKMILSIWWGVKGVIYWDLLSQKNTVNAYRYRAQ